MMKLDQEKFDEGIGQVIKAANTDVLEDIGTLAASLKEEADNELIAQVIEAGKKFQTVYNDSFKPSIDGLIADFRAVYDIAEMVSKANMGEVSATDAGFATSGIDATSVSM